MKSIQRLPAVTARTGLSRSEIYRRVNAGTFPAPVAIGVRARGWLDEELDQWVDGRAAERKAATPEPPRNRRASDAAA